MVCRERAGEKCSEGEKMAAELCEAAAERERPDGKNSQSPPEQPDVENK